MCWQAPLTDLTKYAKFYQGTVVAQLAKALSWEAVDCGFESHQNINLLQIFLQNHTKMAGNSNIIIGWWPINFEEESYASSL